jgi:hypothetical protein
MANYRNTYNGQIRSSESALGYPYIALDDQDNPADAQIEFAERTADAILQDVGTDPVLAAAALTAESEREKPRIVLTRRLQAIIDHAEDES